MIETLEEMGFETISKKTEENIVTRRLEDDNSVIILEESFFEPDEIETTIYIIDGELDLNEEDFEGLTIIN